MSANTAPELINYMSSRLLEVAELNSVLDQFGSSKAIPADSKPSIRFVRHDNGHVGYKFSYTTTIPNPGWLRIICNSADSWDLGGFDFDNKGGPLEIRELSAKDRQELEQMELF